MRSNCRSPLSLRNLSRLRTFDWKSIAPPPSSWDSHRCIRSPMKEFVQTL
jgi:hypothetical protein